MNNIITKSLLVLAARGLILVGAASAQTQESNTSGAGPGQVDPGHPRVNEVNARETNQQDRIANGVKNGTLTPGHTSRIENREQNIENQQKADMAAHNGHLTKGEQRQLNKEQNHVSNRIYKDKHSDPQCRYLSPEVQDKFRTRAADGRGFLISCRVADVCFFPRALVYNGRGSGAPCLRQNGALADPSFALPPVSNVGRLHECETRNGSGEPQRRRVPAR